MREGRSQYGAHGSGLFSRRTSTLAIKQNEDTPYELIDAISGEVQPGEDQLVAEVLLHLFETGRIKLLGRPFKINIS